jgi:hypothetical protein
VAFLDVLVDASREVADRALLGEATDLVAAPLDEVAVMADGR